MTIAQKLSMALSYKGISQAELARRIGTTPSNLNQNLRFIFLIIYDVFIQSQ